MPPEKTLSVLGCYLDLMTLSLGDHTMRSAHHLNELNISVKFQENQVNSPYSGRVMVRTNMRKNNKGQ